ncbi:kelch-like protein 10 [Elysia marginata]|uniref:Kelch-like protein 10 n=1 Tax=Elysia marginata TaxID=1093978 RepID=A0AAV4HDV6_9GAST|nr:kelch-like protein 10 [Elysia marginata]
MFVAKGYKQKRSGCKLGDILPSRLFSSLHIWYDATDMSLYRSALSACVVKGLPNVQEYIYQNRMVNDQDASTTVDPPQASDAVM